MISEKKLQQFKIVDKLRIKLLDGTKIELPISRPKFNIWNGENHY